MPFLAIAINLFTLCVIQLNFAPLAEVRPRTLRLKPIVLKCIKNRTIEQKAPLKQHREMGVHLWRFVLCDSLVSLLTTEIQKSLCCYVYVVLILTID